MSEEFLTTRSKTFRRIYFDCWVWRQQKASWVATTERRPIAGWQGKRKGQPDDWRKADTKMSPTSSFPNKKEARPGSHWPRWREPQERSMACPWEGGKESWAWILTNEKRPREQQQPSPCRGQELHPEWRKEGACWFLWPSTLMGGCTWCRWQPNCWPRPKHWWWYWT